MDLGHWDTVQLLTENTLPYGFIYKITNKTNNKKYIGKKQCFYIRKKQPLKGKKNKRHVIEETDWKIYTSSSTELNNDIKLLGKENFKFEILQWCNSKWQLAYYEAKAQFDEEVLLSDDYYNGIINLRIGKKPKDRGNKN